MKELYNLLRIRESALKEENHMSAKTTMQQILAQSPEHTLPDCAIALQPTGQLLVCKLPIATLELENYSVSDGVSEYPEQGYNLLQSGRMWGGVFKTLCKIFSAKRKNQQYWFICLLAYLFKYTYLA